MTEIKWNRCLGCGILIQFDNSLDICRSCEIRGMKMIFSRETKIEEKEFLCSRCGSREFNDKDKKKICVHCGAESYEIKKTSEIVYKAI